MLKRREVLYLLAKRDISIIYKQSYVGLAWLIFQPLVVTAIYTLIFSKISDSSTIKLWFPLYVLTGVSIWIYFSKSLSEGANSLIANRELIQKTNFPRIFLPMSACITPLLDLVLTTILITVLASTHEISLSAKLLLVPFLILFLYLYTFGIVLILASLNAIYRDIAIALPFLLQVGVFAAPIGYPIELISKKFQIFIELNPLTGIIQFYRYSILNMEFPSTVSIISALGLLVTALTTGLILFWKTEMKIVDQA